MKAKVINEYILVDLIEEKREEKTASGIYIPKMVDETSKTKKCKVLQIGAGVEDPPFSVGDTLVIYYQAGLESKGIGHFIKLDNVYAVLEAE